MRLFLIDAIGPFFRSYEKRRINWSKIPFKHLKTTGPEADTQWQRIEQDLHHLAREIIALGYNAVTLDDLAHLATHPLHETDIAADIAIFRKKFQSLFEILHHQYQLQIFLTTDVLPTTPAIDAHFQNDPAALQAYYIDLVTRTLDDFPLLSGLILRIGESDGQDITDPIRTRLHLRNPSETNHLLHQLIPHFQKRSKTLILRTWTVGAHRIGDLIWHRGTLAQTLHKIDSPSFIVSMKHGESDFFRHLPLNSAFFTLPQQKIIELQARREYEGAGEYPSFIGNDCENFARQLQTAPNLVGVSVWCQTGGWHRFRRLAFLPNNQHPDTWIRLNTAAAIDIFKHKLTVEQSIEKLLGPEKAPPAIELLRHSDTLIKELLYIEEFARQKLFFRRVRIPPLLHAYWDSLFINHAVSKTLRHFVQDQEKTIRTGEAAATLFPQMIRLARQADLPVADIEHMRDLFTIILLARRYYFLPYDETIATKIRDAKRAYKKRHPANTRHRYRIKISFEPFKIKRRTLAWAASLLLRKQRGYRIIDHLFTLHLLGYIFRLFKPRNPKRLPKFLRKSAMPIDTLFK